MKLGWAGRRRWAWACLVAVGTLGIGACGETADDEPELPTVEKTPDVVAESETPQQVEPDPEPTRVLPELPQKPSAMERDDVDGAVAAAEYFLLLYPYVYATGDLDEWREMSHPECGFCESVISNVTELHEQGGEFSGSEISILESVGIPPEDGNGYFGVDVLMSVAEGAISGREEEAGETFEPGERVAALAVARGDGHWLMRGVQIDALGS